jgi:hypothetical protein
VELNRQELGALVGLVEVEINETIGPEYQRAEADRHWLDELYDKLYPALISAGGQEAASQP